MKTRLRKLPDQVIIITGASSGIGLTTARMAAKQGARLVLAARNEDALRQLADEINSGGGQAIAVVADVAREQDVRRIAEAALERFGRFDTWVNNAGVSIFGKLEQTPVEDHRRMFETNYWGVVHGSIQAAAYLRQAGGAIINIGSTLSDRAIPLQGAYCATKHAVKAFTDALRMELEADKAPISVTLIKPAGIDTPYIEHARSFLATAPDVPPPLYAPEAVADAILYAATHPVRDLFVGAAAKALSLAEKYAPRLTDRFMERTMFAMQHSSRPRQDKGPDGLHSHGVGLRQRSGHHTFVQPMSLYTKASEHPVMTMLVGAAGVAIGTALAASRLRS
jgi:short-subunit dehydrogenase